MTEQLHNPKLDEHPGSNTEKNPEDWVSGDDPMTGAQGSYLTTLCEEAGEAPPPTSARPTRQSESTRSRRSSGSTNRARVDGQLASWSRARQIVTTRSLSCHACSVVPPSPRSAARISSVPKP